MGSFCMNVYVCHLIVYPVVVKKKKIINMLSLFSGGKPRHIELFKNIKNKNEKTKIRLKGIPILSSSTHGNYHL